MLYIIITDFNGYTQTRRCLCALRASHYREFQILLVDHGDSDETRNNVVREFPEVIRIQGTSQEWWAGANNRGIQHALAQGASMIMLLNNDCYVLPDTLGLMMNLACHTPDAILAPIQRDWHSKRITAINPHSCFLLGFPTVPGKYALTPAMQMNPLLPVKLIIGGRGVIIPISVWTHIGLLDEKNLPHYGADHDFYLRAHKKGICLYTVTHACVEIDNTRTSLAQHPAHMTFAQLIHSLHSTRSHRNVRDVTALFKAHYPLPYLYLLGVALYLGRYILLYVLKRMWKKLGG
jgi:GT2 family glycosyltransferase